MASPKRGSPLVAERLLEAPAQRDGGVLDGVVGVDVQVAVGLHRQVEQAVRPSCVEHVVVEADAGRTSTLAGAVEVDLDDDLGLLGRRARPGLRLMRSMLRSQ